METSNNEMTIREKVAVVVVVATTAYSVYQLGRLTCDWTKEGIRTFKNRKNPNK